MVNLEERITRLEDEAEIRHLVARFADTCVRDDPDGFSATWSPGPNTTWTLSEPYPMKATGVKDITEMFRQLRTGREFFIQSVLSGVIEISDAGDRATGRWIMRELARGPGDMHYSNYAMYDDEMEKREGKWWFAKRAYNYIFLDSSPFEGKAFQLPEFGK